MFGVRLVVFRSREGCQIGGQVEARLTTLLAEAADPFTRRTLKAVAVATDEPTGWRVRSKFGHGVEDGISIVAQLSGVSIAQTRDVYAQRLPIVLFARVPAFPAS
jgi:hypothetical protein